MLVDRCSHMILVATTLHFFAYLVMIMDSISQSCFRFIGMSMIDLGIARAVGIAIGRAILTKIDIAIGFSKLPL